MLCTFATVLAVISVAVEVGLVSFLEALLYVHT